MEDSTIFTQQFIDAIKKPVSSRTSQESDYICHILKKLSEFQTFDSSSLRTVLNQITYEVHPNNTELYQPGDIASSWYYIVYGSVLISTYYTYGAGCSFGQCIDTNLRTDTCLVTKENTELLKISYTDKELDRFMRRAKNSTATGSLTNSLEMTLTTSAGTQGSAHTNSGSITPTHCTNANHQSKEESVSLSDGELLGDEKKPSHKYSLDKSLSTEYASRDVWGLEKLDPLDHIGNHDDEDEIEIENDSRRMSQKHGHASKDDQHFRFDEKDVKTLSVSNDSLHRALEDDPLTGGERERERGRGKKIPATEVTLRDRRKVAHRRSAPPTSQRSLRDSVGSLDYLSESQVDIDSDDEESAHSETSSSPGMDSVYEVLNKPPPERTDEDIERVTDVLQYMPAFSNMTSNIRRALFQVLLLTTFPEEGSVVVDNGEQVNKWFVVLHGQVRQIRDSETDKIFHIGETFGVSKSLKVLPHRGKLVTSSKDCQLCYVSSEEYGRVLAQGEENLKRIEENGQVVAVLEKRAVSAKREGYFVVQATPQKLLDYLLEEGVDDTFHSDFLLTYRSFFDSIDPIVSKIKDTWSKGLPEQRERITMIVLNWVSEHYADFEEDDSFLDWFEEVLIEESKIGEKRILDEARISNAKYRTIQMERDGINSPLDFSVVGGWELRQPIFVSEIVPNSIPAQEGLKVGDQILSINDTKCEGKELREVLQILQKNYKLEIVVKFSLPKFKQFMLEPQHVEIQRSHTVSVPSHSFISRSNSTSASTALKTNKSASSTAQSDSPKIKKRGPGFLKPIFKSVSKSSMEKFRSRLRHQHSSTQSESNTGSESPSGPLKARKKLGARKASEENLLDDGGSSSGKVLRPASSAEDLHTLNTHNSPKVRRHGGSGRHSRTHVVDSVVKLYALDHSVKYLDITPATTVAEIIERGVKDFYPDRFVPSPSDEFCICMVTVQSRSGPIKNSVLPGHLTDLANFIGLGSRYYLKERAYHGTLVQDEEAERIVKESRQWELIYNLKAMQVAEELTRRDSSVFSSIFPSEFISDLWKSPDKAARRHLIEFEEIPNDEMYWVITTIVSEPSATNRSKIIKHFIKIAKCCKTLKNYNTMFHLLSGLNHGLVQRLRSSWEKVPHRYKKTMEDLGSFMNPFHNMVKYRELQRQTQPPLIPFFPIIKKDLTFLFDGNDTIVSGLINFEKLRMLSRQIRIVKGFCTATIEPTPPEVDLSQLGIYNRTIGSLHGSLRWKQRSPTNTVSLTENALKRVYMHSRLSKMVSKHLSQKYVLQDENYLEQIVDSQEKLSNVNKRTPSSPMKGKKSLVVESKHRSANISPSPTANSLGSDISAHQSIDLCPTSSSPATISIPATASLNPSMPLDVDADYSPRSPSMNSFTSTSSAPMISKKD
ncbi:PREDICTED: rap guanine nucleotide exchange factor 6-like isoform X2 [Amphimedon queenslandica]|uniref:Uncharacterized protein n=1 Tax=Amphimedon queenslandica TaxID=400682 RepID=A0A1X7V122_AMPQE|nr:PREDICTED: rap guanine nucleotide exchange factor 6-like isoform X2 [Amphimedon queenslandica]|eukprot:XP_019851253.1 PREDICTED: rap guanine nucleotide exchange factor 6-like isoform X2 [Amphimedon queenslandica]